MPHCWCCAVGFSKNEHFVSTRYAPSALPSRQRKKFSGRVSALRASLSPNGSKRISNELLTKRRQGAFSRNQTQPGFSCPSKRSSKTISCARRDEVDAASRKTNVKNRNIGNLSLEAKQTRRRDGRKGTQKNNDVRRTTRTKTRRRSTNDTKKARRTVAFARRRARLKRGVREALFGRRRDEL